MDEDAGPGLETVKTETPTERKARRLKELEHIVRVLRLVVTDSRPSQRRSS